MLKRLLPWVVSGGLLLYLGLTTDLARVWDAFQQAPLGRFVLVVLAGTLAAFLYDTLCLTLLLRRFNAPVTFREMLPLKGASYFLNVINYNAAMGGMALYLKRVRKVSFLESASSLLYMNALDVFALCALIALGLGLSGGAVGTALSAETRGGLWVVVLVFGGILLGALVYWNGGFDYFVLGRLRSWRIFHAFRKARVRDYVWLLAARAVMVLIYVVVTWAFAWIFGIHVPFVAILALQPIIIFIGTIPVSIAGLGTTQVVMRAFYGGYAAYLALQPVAEPLVGALTAPLVALPAPVASGLAAQAALEAAQTSYWDTTGLVDAFSTAAIFSVVLVRILIGYLFLQHVTDRLADAGEGADDGAEAEAAV